MCAKLGMLIVLKTTALATFARSQDVFAVNAAAFTEGCIEGHFATALRAILDQRGSTVAAELALLPILETALGAHSRGGDTLAAIQRL